jgi:hypothetical protein
MRNRVHTAAAVAFALSICTFASHACDLRDKLTHAYVLKQSGGYDEVLQELADQACLGSKENDKVHPLVAEFERLTPDLTNQEAGGQPSTEIRRIETSADRLAAVDRALNALIQFAAARSGGARSDAWVALKVQLDVIRASVIDATKEAKTDKAAMLAELERALPRAWDRKVPFGSKETLGKAWSGIPYLTETGCQKESKVCESFDSQVDLIRVYNLVARLRRYMQFDTLVAVHADANLQQARWKAYSTGGRPLYFWEVLVNGLAMGKDLCPTDARTDIQRGFCAVPSKQLILLHPEPVLAFNHKASAANELNGALLIELIGYHRWNWVNGTDAMRGRIGASLAAAYVQRGQGRTWSYGPSFTWGEGSSLAFTRAPGGKWSLLVNISLAGDYYGRKAKYVQYLKSLEKDPASLF